MPGWVIAAPVTPVGREAYDLAKRRIRALERSMGKMMTDKAGGRISRTRSAVSWIRAEPVRNSCPMTMETDARRAPCLVLPPRSVGKLASKRLDKEVYSTWSIFHASASGRFHRVAAAAPSGRVLRVLDPGSGSRLRCSAALIARIMREKALSQSQRRGHSREIDEAVRATLVDTLSDCT